MKNKRVETSSAEHIAESLGVIALWISIAFIVASVAKCTSDNHKADLEFCKDAKVCVH